MVLHGEVSEKISFKPLRRGLTVQPRQTLITVAKPCSLEAIFQVQEKDLTQLFADAMDWIQGSQRFLEDHADLSTPDLMHFII